MKSYLVFLPIFILALIQGAVLPFNLVLLVVSVWAVIKPPKISLIIAFFSGLFLDLTKGTPLGFSSLILLATCYLLHLYSRRFDPTHLFFLPTFVFLLSLAWNLLVKEPWLWESLVLTILALAGRPIVKFYQEDISHERLKLKI